MRNFVFRILNGLRPFFELIIYQKHGILGRRISSRLLNWRFESKLSKSPEKKEFFERINWEKDKNQFYQLEKIKEMVNYAYQYVPFYKKYYDQVGFSPNAISTFNDIEKIPVLKKDVFKEALLKKQAFSTEDKSWQVTPSETTGSTGVPLTVYIDKTATTMRRFAKERAWFMNKINPGDPFLLLWRRKKIDSRELASIFFGNFLYLSVLNVADIRDTVLDKQKIFTLLKKIESFQPRIIRGYVSALEILAKFYAKNKNKFKINPEKIIGSAEYLSSTTWDELEEIFGAKVYNFYGGTEASPIAMSTTNSRELVVFEDVFHIDLDFSQPEFKEAGVGRILVTDLHNKYMPLIRYEIGDLAKWGSESEMGLRTFSEVKGRLNDLFVLPGGKILFPDCWYIFFRGLSWIKRFKVIQNDINVIQILLETDDLNVDYEEELKNVKKSVFKSVGNDVKISWEITDQIPLDRGDKFRHVISQLEVNKLINNI